MKPATSATIIALLAIGAVLYSGSSALSMAQSQRSSDNSGFGPNPLEAGALAAKPNGVPTCLTLCQPGGAQDPDNDGDSDFNTAQSTAPVQRTVVVHRTVVVAQPAATTAPAPTTAPATRTVTVVQPVRVIVAQPQAVQVVAAQPHPVVVRRVATTTLPATGPSALATATGLSAMSVTAYYFLRARRRAKPSKSIS